MKSRRCLIPVAAFMAVTGDGSAAFPTLKLRPLVLQQIHSPTNITAPADGSGRVFICDQPGKIHILRNAVLLPTPFLDVGAKMVSLTTSYSERGLLGMAFHPGFANPASPGHRKFYLAYNAPAATATPNPSSPQNSVIVIAEYQASAANPDLADPASERVVLTIGRPQSNHNGGQLQFGPDGFLYISSGDGGNANDNTAGHTGGSGSGVNGVLGNGQDRRNLLGKILRIDPLDPDGAGPLTYSIPASNPFVGQIQDFPNDTLDGPMRGEIYAWGLRNAWRFSFDSRPGGTNRLFCADVGQGRVEEVNLITSGGNYGWRYREGTFVFDSQMTATGVAPAGSIDPIAQYAHPGVSTGTPALPQLGVSITGGYVYRGTAIPALLGKYLFADYSSSSATNTGRIMGLEETAPGSGTFTLDSAVPIVGGNPISTSVLTFGEDASGEFLVGTKSNGGVLQLANGFPAGGIYQIVPESQATPPYQAWRSTHFPALLTGQYLDPLGDPDGDGLPNEIEYAYGFSPLVANPPASTGFTATRAPGAGGSADFTVTFRRAPGATDVTYDLQASAGLAEWTTIATSAGGAAATGANGGVVLDDSEIAGQAPFRRVTVGINLPAGTTSRFVRLRTSRTP